MREFKFRVYDYDLRVMYTPEMDEEHGNLWSLDRAQGGVLSYPKGELMQYTGLKDKNGKEIYEGDIVKCDYGDDEHCDIRQIRYMGEEGYPAFELFPDIDCECNGLSYFNAVGSIEVIGNIYENEQLTRENQ